MTFDEILRTDDPVINLIMEKPRYQWIYPIFYTVSGSLAANGTLTLLITGHRELLSLITDLRVTLGGTLTRLGVEMGFSLDTNSYFSRRNTAAPLRYLAGDSGQRPYTLVYPIAIKESGTLTFDFTNTGATTGTVYLTIGGIGINLRNMPGKYRNIIDKLQGKMKPYFMRQSISIPANTTRNIFFGIEQDLIGKDFHIMRMQGLSTDSAGNDTETYYIYENAGSGLKHSLEGINCTSHLSLGDYYMDIYPYMIKQGQSMRVEIENRESLTQTANVILAGVIKNESYKF